MYDSGKTVRTWCYISDLTIMLLNIITRGKSFIYNVSGEEHFSILEVAKKISKLRNNLPIKLKNKNLKYTSSKPSILRVSSKKYKKEFKLSNNISFIEGIKRLIEWNLDFNKKMNNLILRILDLAKNGEEGHVPSSLSILDIVEVLDDRFITKNKQDKFILSKGHASLALYVVLENLKLLKI